ncbi:MAG: Uncharacterised protein [Bacteroidetes bacterium MED-G17]|nr:MAG: Uncharacterised protein [Bacteroidetes bacterium MED-G17]
MAAFIPPWAAIECALRGLSWKQNVFTLYPSSANVAEADAPAKPVPMTIMSILLLLFGATRFILPLWLDHLFSNDPFGILDFKTVIY